MEDKTNEPNDQALEQQPNRSLFKSARPVVRPSNSNGDTSKEPEIDLDSVPTDIFARFESVAEEAGGEFEEPEIYRDSVARTMFDTPQSKDNTVTLVLPSGNIERLPTQSLVRIESTDGRRYLGVIVEGPFAEPDGLRADSPIVITVTVQGSIFMPNYHGRVQIAILGEQTEDGMMPPRFRPLPNSPVFPLSEPETAQVLQIAPDGPAIPLGYAVGHENLPVAIPADKRGVLARHMAILGTTGGGKTTTVSGLVNNFQKANLATVLIDTEGEYTVMNDPTDKEKMQRLLARRGLKPAGVQSTVIYHLVGKGTANPGHPRRYEFCLRFSNLSPYLVAEILEMNEAQEQRFHYAYDIARRVLADLKIYPTNEEQAAKLLELDELEVGYPGMKLEHIYDIVRACAQIVNHQRDSVAFSSSDFSAQRDRILSILDQYSDMPKHWTSWLNVQGRLRGLLNLKIFDSTRSGVTPLDPSALTTPGQVSIIDLSGTDSPQVNNLVIAELLRGVLERQNLNFERVEKKQEALRRTMVVIEEAHEFLSRERIRQMPALFQQVARIARRGRKRWLGLVFVTQLPQHLPDEVLGLVNNFILHKIADSGVIAMLRKSIGGIDESLWLRLPNLAPGQAIVSMTSMARPLLVAMDPTPCRLRMTEEE
ncbi:MAG TPA: ATP-binding protein [Chthonomonadaceae bacterium]|nr:ATP-binding protein [Chthonomonadaceae bacterium]